MRGADGGPWSRICALPAFWVGLLYDNAALDAAWDVVKHWTMEERQALRDDVPRLALDSPIPGGRTLQDVAREIVNISAAGLTARARFNGSEITNRAILIRFRRSSLRARFRRSGCSIIKIGRGRATSATSMRKRVSDRHLLLRRLQRSHIALLPPGDPAEQPGKRPIAVQSGRTNRQSVGVGRGG